MVKTDTRQQEELHQIADTMAREFTRRGTDLKEVAGALATLRHMGDGRRFFTYLDIVVKHGEVRSKKTPIYYRIIREVCKKHLHAFQDQPRIMAQILGWASRLMRYYKEEDKLERPSAIKAAVPSTAPKPAADSNRQTGQIRSFDAKKGYGFITPDGGGKDLFFHKSQLTKGVRAPTERTKVSFVIGKGPRGRNQAQDVQPA